MSQANDKNTNDKPLSGFLGKLPGFSDFIKFNSGGKEIQAIDTWIQAGLALAKIKYKTEWQTYYSICSKVNFVYPFTDTENTIIGVITPATDKSGRNYPFTIFANIHKSEPDHLQHYFIPAEYQCLYTAFNDIIDMNYHVEDIANLKSLTSSIILKNHKGSFLMDDYQRFLKEKRLIDFFDFHGNSSIQPSDLFRKKIVLIDNICVFHFVPVLQEQTNSFLIVYYTLVILRILKLTNSVPGIFWMQNDDQSGYLFLFLTKPSSSDLINLLFYEGLLLDNQNQVNQDEINLNNTLNLIFKNGIYINDSISLIDFYNSITSIIY